MYSNDKAGFFKVFPRHDMVYFGVKLSKNLHYKKIYT